MNDVIVVNVGINWMYGWRGRPRASSDLITTWNLHLYWVHTPPEHTRVFPRIALSVRLSLGSYVNIFTSSNTHAHPSDVWACPLYQGFIHHQKMQQYFCKWVLYIFFAFKTKSQKVNMMTITCNLQCVFACVILHVLVPNCTFFTLGTSKHSLFNAVQLYGTYIVNRAEYITMSALQYMQVGQILLVAKRIGNNVSVAWFEEN